ncbi:NAD(+)/NADH kinase [Gehongia tenuis]|uniref:NAD kinase n=1 Tax=Gehongia tenuis TaxID=2763655 RepID=A0A926D2F7_9FIRM|nr:NAD(+)/NADH kinase [Gehongia tenuis]MBC8531175.1 NAD(+)/NADH kinase [Gehongia tenuis]
MPTIGIFVNLQKDRYLDVTRQLVDELTHQQADFYLETSIAAALQIPEFGMEEEELYRNCQVLMALGGDGTILGVARRAAPIGIPIAGINLGRMGFLTEIEIGDLKKVVRQILAGRYEVEHRMMLAAKVTGPNRPEPLEIQCAMNDLMVTRHSVNRMLRVVLEANNGLLDRFSGDGVVIASPTGSTGYSLSAGGPIVDPLLPCMVVTPICAHTLHSRSMVLSRDEEIRIRAARPEEAMLLMVDGQESYAIFPGDEIAVARSPYEALFLRLQARDFYSLVRNKLWEWSQ